MARQALPDRRRPRRSRFATARCGSNGSTVMRPSPTARAMKAAGVTAADEARRRAGGSKTACSSTMPDELVEQGRSRADLGRARRGAGQGAGASCSATALPRPATMRTPIDDWKTFRRAGARGRECAHDGYSPMRMALSRSNGFRGRRPGFTATAADGRGQILRRRRARIARCVAEAAVRGQTGQPRTAVPFGRGIVGSG